jgi:hypothetical protein
MEYKVSINTLLLRISIKLSIGCRNKIQGLEQWSMLLTGPRKITLINDIHEFSYLYRYFINVNVR